MSKLEWISRLFWGWVRGTLMTFSAVGILATIDGAGADISVWHIIAVVVGVAVLDGIARAMLEKEGER